MDVQAINETPNRGIYLGARPLHIGMRCSIVETGLSGLLVGKRSYLGAIDRFTVRYLDASGSQQEREFDIWELLAD